MKTKMIWRIIHFIWIMNLEMNPCDAQSIKTACYSEPKFDRRIELPNNLSITLLDSVQKYFATLRSNKVNNIFVTGKKICSLPINGCEGPLINGMYYSFFITYEDEFNESGLLIHSTNKNAFDEKSIYFMFDHYLNKGTLFYNSKDFVGNHDNVLKMVQYKIYEMNLIILKLK